MPRPKKATIDERLVQVNQLIDEYTEKIKELKDEKKELEIEIKNRDVSELYEIIKNSGKTIAEVKEMLAK